MQERSTLKHTDMEELVSKNYQFVNISYVKSGRKWLAEGFE